jgi:hypothetical protein
MGRYRSFERPTIPTKTQLPIHPIWQGIGCILIIIIPIMAYAASVLLVQADLQQGWLPIPLELAQTITLPVIGPIDFLLANLMVTAVLVFLGYGILALVYAILGRIAGSTSHGPLDMPMERRGRR